MRETLGIGAGAKLNRRVLLAAAPALALARPSAATSLRELGVRGQTTYSESAMVMSVSADGRSALTLRFCRFPDAGLTWLWCHLVRDGVVYAFTQNDLPCSTARLADGEDADYDAPPMAATLVRAGRGPLLQRVRISTALPFHKSAAAPRGPGAVKGRFEGQFTPAHRMHTMVLKNRDGVYGTLHAEIEVGGQRWVHEGVAKFHEQRQDQPRFADPFCYAWLGREGAATTTLLGAKGASGGWLFGDDEDAVRDLLIDPPGASRKVDFRLGSARTLQGELSAIVRYEIPIYDRRWLGSFVRGLVGGKAVVGVLNDWTTQPDIYAAARARWA